MNVKSEINNDQYTQINRLVSNILVEEINILFEEEKYSYMIFSVPKLLKDNYIASDTAKKFVSKAQEKLFELLLKKSQNPMLIRDVRRRLDEIMKQGVLTQAQVDKILSVINGVPSDDSLSQ
ncbi:MAG: hypothetical protein H6772_00955 [Pseudomonadales bacterium]|nr:hypothetical protein [Pseudomonadales bacterium]